MTTRHFPIAEAAIRAIFDDPDASRDDTLDDLETLKSGIEDLIEQLEHGKFIDRPKDGPKPPHGEDPE